MPSRGSQLPQDDVPARWVALVSFSRRKMCIHARTEPNRTVLTPVARRLDASVRRMAHSCPSPRQHPTMTARELRHPCYRPGSIVRGDFVFSTEKLPPLDDDEPPQCSNGAVMELAFWLPALFILGLSIMALMFVFMAICERV
jgi:hypothetical protein